MKTSEEIVLFGRVVTDLWIAGKDPKVDNQDPRFARIYGFSFDGAYYDMLSPVLFEVNGKGNPAQTCNAPGPGQDQKEFLESLQVWTVNMNNKSIRLDIETGKFEHLLLAGMGDGGGGGVSGARVSGARVSGARVSGARVSGARVSGARVSGARVSGARISDD